VAKRTPSDDDSSAPGAAKRGRQAERGSEALPRRARGRLHGGATPCDLVTAAQARAILGAPMREPVEAAQGPTCIYRTRDGRAFVTVAVQTLEFAKLRPHLRLARRVAVSGRTAWCGTYGQPMLYVPLSRGRLLSIAARCAVARRFAIRAVPQLRD
jgi:hypothetical protein